MVEDIIETVIEIQLYGRHQNTGYPPVSATGSPLVRGDGERRDQCMQAAMRYQQQTEWQEFCLWVLCQLPPRQRAAVLVAAFKPDNADLKSQWELLRRLDLQKDAEGGFCSLEALNKCARRGKAKIREIALAKAAEISDD